MKVKARKMGKGYMGCRFALEVAPEDEAYMHTMLDRYKDTILLEVEIKKHVAKRTKKQLGVFFLAWDFYCTKMRYLDDSERYNLRKGFEARYGLRKESGMYDDEGNPILMIIGLKEANKLDHFEALFQGLFHLMETDDVDYLPFLEDWEAWKREHKDAVCTT